MALEPYRPPSDNRYRDELDREIDQKIDTFFHRWNWKLVRFIRRAVDCPVRSMGGEQRYSGRV